MRGRACVRVCEGNRVTKQTNNLLHADALATLASVPPVCVCARCARECASGLGFLLWRGAPRLAPLCRRSSTGRVGPAPGPPRPLPYLLCLCGCVCYQSLVWCRTYLICSARCGRGARVGGLLGSLCSLRFKWALVRAPLPSGNDLVR